MTANRAWRGGRRFKTTEYKAYERTMLLTLPKVPIPDGKLRLDLIAGLSNVRMDIDNVLKPMIDIMQKKYDFNDNRIYCLTVEKRIVKKGDEFIDFEITGYGGE